MDKNYPAFRLLRANEIEVRVGRTNKGGAQILLYKDARVDMKLLDETVGPMNWQKVYTRDNQNCIVSIRHPETGEWISKEDTGTESNTQAEKGLASDSFKRAMFNWNCGRELYTASKLNLFVTGKLLNSLQEGLFAVENDKGKCNAVFDVQSIEYNEEDRYITSVKIGIYDIYSNYLGDKTFFLKKPVISTSTQVENKNITNAVKETTKPVVEEKEQPVRYFNIPKENSLFKEDEVMLLGKVNGYTFGKVKYTNTFQQLLLYVLNTDKVYNEEEKDKQFNKLKLFAGKYKIA